MGVLRKVYKGCAPKKSIAINIGHDGACSDPYKTVGMKDIWIDFEKEQIEYAIALSHSEGDRKGKKVIDQNEVEQLQSKIQELEEKLKCAEASATVTVDELMERRAEAVLTPYLHMALHAMEKNVPTTVDKSLRSLPPLDLASRVSANLCQTLMGVLLVNQQFVSTRNEVQQLQSKIQELEEKLKCAEASASMTIDELMKRQAEAVLTPQLRMALHAMEKSVPTIVDKSLQSLPPLELASRVSADLCQALTGVLLVNQQFVSARNEVEQLQSKILKLEEKLKCAEASASVTVDELMKRLAEAVKAARAEAVDNAIAAFKTTYTLEAQELLGCLNLQAEVKTRYPNLDWSWMNKASIPERKE